MRRFWILLKKELRELVTLQMLLPFVIVVVMFVALGQMLSSVGGNGDGARPVTVIDADKTSTSKLIITTLEKSGFKVVVPESSDAAAVATSLPRSSGTVVVAIPAGFEAGLSAGKPQQVLRRLRVGARMPGQHRFGFDARLERRPVGSERGRLRW